MLPACKYNFFDGAASRRESRIRGTGISLQLSLNDAPAQLWFTVTTTPMRTALNSTPSKQGVTITGGSPRSALCGQNMEI